MKIFTNRKNFLKSDLKKKTKSFDNSATKCFQKSRKLISVQRNVSKKSFFKKKDP